MTLPVVFPFAFNKVPDKTYTALAQKFVRRVKELRGKVYQLTDFNTPEIDGIDGCFRSQNGEFGHWYFSAMDLCPLQEFLRLDADINLPYGIPSVPGNYEIAVPKEIKGVMNNGVVFVRNRHFFFDGISAYHKTTRNGWNDIQVATQMVIDSGEYRVKKLDPYIYNWMPTYKDQRNPEALIVHYEGPERKAWMP